MGSLANELAVEKSPPEIRFTTGVVGERSIYLALSKGVKTTNLSGLLEPIDFILQPPLGSTHIIQDPVIIISEFDGSPGFAREVLLTLDQPISPDFALDAKIGLENTVVDSLGNEATGIAERRAMDLAQVANPQDAFPGGLLRVLGLSDGVHAGDPEIPAGALPTGALGLLREFDGTGRLYDRDTTVFTALNLGGADLYPLTLYYDVNPPSDADANFLITNRGIANGSFWLPSILSGFNLNSNTNARSLSPLGTAGDPRNFVVPGYDPEIQAGAAVGFLFRYGPLWVARATDVLNPQAFDLWRYRVEDVLKQRGGVTIVNNVINSLKRERAAVQIDLQTAGQATILVFTLDGDVVRALHRGRLAAGTYTMTWDGTNSGGNPVARGVYFIRVVAPGIDEIRKVMVIKD